ARRGAPRRGRARRRRVHPLAELGPRRGRHHRPGRRSRRPRPRPRRLPGEARRQRQRLERALRRPL
ncbi:MAG: hypothetical protein AVDCRST_MAG30-255, partial [uncultured Solirubrobacteraceae bacterium]